MLRRCLGKPREHLDRLLKGLGKFSLLLITPSRLQPAQPPVQPGHKRLHLIVKSIEVLGESAKFRGVYMCFAHGDTIYHMMRWNLIIAVLCGLLCGLAKPADQDGWRTLFDGKNLDNF